MPDRLAALREEMAHHNIGYYLVLSQDAHNSEYVAPCDERRQYLTGFTGSAGTAIVAFEWAELATDGRYFIQAAHQLNGEWKLRREGIAGVQPWWKAVAEEACRTGRNIGVDACLITHTDAQRIMGEMKGTDAALCGITPNLVDKIWGDLQPPEATNPVEALDILYTGRTYFSKLMDVRQLMLRVGANALIITALDEICWLLNIRVVGDIDYNPVFKAFLLVESQKVTLYTHPRTLPECMSTICIREYGTVYNHLREISKAGFKICGSSESDSWAITDCAGRNYVDHPSLIAPLKARKNPRELAGARDAQLKCGLSVVRYLSWLKEQVTNGIAVSEYDGALKLLEFRKALPEFRGESFATISSAGPNAAIIHYKPASDKSRLISSKEVYLLDSGCHFTHGTTDTTRTVHFGNPTIGEKKAYTLVLKGHIALATAIFPVGTSGIQLDPMARQFLWREKLDYNHGTGHGVGAFLNVHEGPMAISPTRANAIGHPLEVGNIISNEPGYYKEGEFGVRIESLLIVQPLPDPSNSAKAFLEFQTITLVPFCHALIEPSMLTTEEVKWINDYNKLVRDTLWGHLNQKERRFVLENTQAL